MSSATAKSKVTLRPSMASMTHELPPIPGDVHAYYETLSETDRLTATAIGRLECLRTQELLRELLPTPPADLLDVGGATGIHAKWLSDDGYTVRLIDPIPGQVEVAAKVGGFSAEVGDARRLEAADNSVDAVLLLGPLYHLPHERDRRLVWAEAHRVLRPGGLVAAAAINRYAALMGLGAQHRLDETTMAMLREVHQTGLHNTQIGFATAYYHRADELLSEVEQAGFVYSQVISIEGPLWSAVLASGDEDLLPYAVRVAQEAQVHDELTSSGAHLLAVGRKAD